MVANSYGSFCFSVKHSYFPRKGDAKFTDFNFPPSKKQKKKVFLKICLNVTLWSLCCSFISRVPVITLCFASIIDTVELCYSRILEGLSCKEKLEQNLFEK